MGDLSEDVRETVTIITTDDPDVLQGVLDLYTPDELRAYPVPRRVNNPANDSAEVIEEINIGEQVGFDEFAS